MKEKEFLKKKKKHGTMNGLRYYIIWADNIQSEQEN